MRPHAEFLTRSRFLELDGYRGLGVMFVISHHLKQPVLEWANPYGAMTIFFIVSGFVITTLALREERQRGALHLKAFYVRRAVRILPPYFVVLGVYWLLILGLGIGAEKADALRKLLPAYLLYYQEVPFFLPEPFGIEWGKNVPFYQSWSLGIEEKFYLLWPLVGFVLLRGAGRVRTAVALALGVACAAAPLAGLVGECVFPYWNILCGCVLATVLDDARWYGVLSRLVAGWRGGLVMLGALAVHLLAGLRFELRYLHPLVVAFGLVPLLIADGPVQRVMRHPISVWLGSISYGIYLVHLLCVNVAERLVPGWLPSWIAPYVLFVFAIAITVVVAAALHRVVERPCIEIGKRVTRRWVPATPRRG